jgi:hypothetical protein
MVTAISPCADASPGNATEFAGWACAGNAVIAIGKGAAKAAIHNNERRMQYSPLEP